MSTENTAHISSRIAKLKTLLAGRQEEYEIFGCTSEDMRQDANIRRKINNLERTLKGTL